MFAQCDAGGGRYLKGKLWASGGQLSGVGHTQYREIVHHVPYNNFGANHSAPAREGHTEILGVGDHMPVGRKQAISIKQESGARGDSTRRCQMSQR